MSISVFDKLLESYSGMRKRTWEPSILVEALDDEQLQKFNDVYNAIKDFLSSAQPGQQQTGFGDNKNLTLTKAPTGLAFSVAGSNLGAKGKSFRGGLNDFTSRAAATPNSKAAAVLSAWSPKDKDGKEDTEKSKKEPADAGAQTEIQGFSPAERDDIAKYIEQKSEEDPTKAQAFVQKLQNSILTPLSKTKLGKIFSGRPDLTPTIQKQLFNITSRFFSMAGKVELITLGDGTQVKVIRSGRLSPGDRSASKVITARGTDGSKGVFFGRSDGDFEEEYKELQEYSQAYDHKTYGLSLGKAMAPYGTAVFDARILPDGIDPTTMTKEDFEKLDLVVQKSTSTATGSGQNDTKGKLFEDMTQLVGAILTGDKSQKKEAIGELKKRLEKIGSLGSADVEHLESALLSSEADDLESLLESQNIESELRRVLQTQLKKLNKVKELLGVTSVKQSLRPSASSKIGERADNEWILPDDSALKGDYKDLMNEADGGDYRLLISVKEYDNPTSETVLGSNSIHNAYGAGEAAAYDQLHEEHMERALNKGYLDEKQVEAAKKALEDDRQALKTLEDTLGSLTNPNKASLKSQINTLIKNAGNQGFTTIAAQQAYVRELQSLKDTIETERNPRKAAVKLFQLGRIVRAEKDSQYAAGAFTNDSILSMGSFENELIMRGSPIDVSLAQTHDLLGRIAQDAFSGQMNISFGIGGTSMKDSEGNVLARNRVAGKEKKQFVEGRVPFAGKERYMETHAI